MRFEGKSRPSPVAGRDGAAICRGSLRRARPLPRSICRWVRLKKVVEDLPGAAAFHADVSDSASVDEPLAKVEADLGPLAIIGQQRRRACDVPRRRVKPLIEKQQAEQRKGRSRRRSSARGLTDDEWRWCVSAPRRTSTARAAAVKRMAPRGEGAIVNMASICGSRLHGAPRITPPPAASSALRGPPPRR